MGSNELGGASMEALVGAFVELDRELADDLCIAVGSYTGEQMQEISGDAMLGHDVALRVSRIGRLEMMRHALERELAL
jgi:hypothetical protein